jgi:caffeoyl-CoA O-methyltransferase
MPKATALTDDLYSYLLAHRSPGDDLLEELRAETVRLAGGRAIMQISPDQGAFLQLLVAAIGARHAVEAGVFTGYSSLCIARGLPPDGNLLCCDVSEEYTAVARRYWERAGVSQKIDLRIAPAADTLAGLAAGAQFDFGFIDADKVNYAVYYEQILKRLRPGGIIAVDNVLWHGSVIDPHDQSADTVAIRRFNDAIARDSRIECVMLHISDGLTLARKL